MSTHLHIGVPIAFSSRLLHCTIFQLSEPWHLPFYIHYFEKSNTKPTNNIEIIYNIKLFNMHGAGF
jgi:hypothetical protein